MNIFVFGKDIDDTKKQIIEKSYSILNIKILLSQLFYTTGNKAKMNRIMLEQWQSEVRSKIDAIYRMSLLISFDFAQEQWLFFPMFTYNWRVLLEARDDFISASHYWRININPRILPSMRRFDFMAPCQSAGYVIHRDLVYINIEITFSTDVIASGTASVFFPLSLAPKNLYS